MTGIRLFLDTGVINRVLAGMPLPSSTNPLFEAAQSVTVSAGSFVSDHVTGNAGKTANLDRAEAMGFTIAPLDNRDFIRVTSQDLGWDMLPIIQAKALSAVLVTNSLERCKEAAAMEVPCLLIG